MRKNEVKQHRNVSECINSRCTSLPLGREKDQRLVLWLHASIRRRTLQILSCFDSTEEYSIHQLRHCAAVAIQDAGGWRAHTHTQSQRHRVRPRCSGCLSLPLAPRSIRSLVVLSDRAAVRRIHTVWG